MYGELKAFYKRWGIEGDPPGTSFHELKTRPCSRAELGLEGKESESRFFPAKSASIGYLRDYGDTLQCIDEDIVIKGSYQSYAAQMLSIQFEACDYINNSTCKSYEEIRQFMRRKFVVTFENSESFKADKYDQRKVTKESKFIWHPMTTLLREESVSEVHVSEVTLQD